MSNTAVSDVTRRRILTFTGSALAWTVLTAAAPAPVIAQSRVCQATSKTPKKGGTLKVAIAGEPPALDPGFTTAGITASTMWHVFEGLLTRSGRHAPIPHLAERYDVNQEGTRFIFHLRKGVPFHNEQEFTAADAAASLKRWGVVAIRGRVIFGRVDTVEETDRYTVTMTFKEPTGLLPEFLVQAEASMLPKEIADKVGKNQLTAEMAIGTGPYKLVEHKVDRHLRLQRWAKYVPREEPANGMGGKRVAYFDELIFIPVPEASVRADGVATGEYHFAEALEPDQYPNLKDSPGVEALVVKPSSQ